jgi:putative tricarboxylic transport membrane protein
MNPKVLIEGILVLFFGLVAMIEGLRLIIYKDPYVLYDPLGPGVYILVLSLGLLVAGIVHFISNYRKLPSKVKVAADKEMRIQLFSSMGILVAYILLVEFIGYFVATLTFFFLELRVAGVKSWRTNIILTLILSVVYYVIFVKFCDMVFPEGILF